MAEMFCEATWSLVKAGDVVLMPWSSIDQVIEAEVVEVEEGASRVDGIPVIFASLDLGEELNG